MARDQSQTLASRFHDTAARFSESPAVTLSDTTLTYSELSAAIHALAAGLDQLGVGPDQRVAVLLPNCPQFVISYFAIQQLGATIIPLHCMQGPHENAYVIEDGQADTLIALGDFSEVIAGIRELVPSLARVIISGETSDDEAISFEQLLQSPPAKPVQDRSEPHDVAAFMYTSGTTGRPKGAMLTHKNLIANAEACQTVLEITQDDVFCDVLPLFHSFGATVCMILPLISGARVVQLPRFSALSVLQTLQDARCTVFAAVPSMYAMMARTKSSTEFDLSALHAAVSGGAPLPRTTLEACRQRLGIDIIEGYGPTEASPVVSVNPLDGTGKLGTVGPPVPGVHVKVVDDQFNELPAGEPGELCVRGPNIMKGYWQAPEKTAQTIKDGWLLTGDIATIDEDGYISIVDRKKDMIIVGGMNVYSREVENVIDQIEQVAEAAVVARPSSIRGEDVAAFIQLKDGMALQGEDVIAHCRQYLASYKVPSSVEFLSEMPRSATGKVLKRELREQHFGRNGPASNNEDH